MDLFIEHSRFDVYLLLVSYKLESISMLTLNSNSSLALPGHCCPCYFRVASLLYSYHLPFIVILCVISISILFALNSMIALSGIIYIPNITKKNRPYRSVFFRAASRSCTFYIILEYIVLFDSYNHHD